MSVIVKRKMTCTWDDGLVFIGQSTATVANTTVETTQFPSSGIGTLSLPPGFFRDGTTIRIALRGNISASGTPTTTIRVRLGGITLATNVASIPVGMSENSLVTFDFELTCRSEGASGSVVGNGLTHLMGGAGLVTANHRAIQMLVPATINTNVEQVLDVTYQWGTADVGNILNITNASVQLLETSNHAS